MTPPAPDRPDDGGPAMLLLTNGQIAVIDDGDFASVNLWPWRVGTNGYVYRAGGRSEGTFLLHRFIMQPAVGEEVHHRNGDRLDNRRANLEVLSASEHQTKYHSSVLADRNRQSRIYPARRACAGCGIEFEVNRDHRGRNRFCTRACGNKNRKKVLHGS